MPIIIFGLIGTIAAAFRGELLAGAPLFVFTLLFIRKPANQREWLFYILAASIFFSLWNYISFSAAFALFSAVSLFMIFMRERLRPGTWREILEGMGGIFVWWLGIFLWQVMKAGRIGARSITANFFWTLFLFFLILMLLQVWRRLVPVRRRP